MRLGAYWLGLLLHAVPATAAEPVEVTTDREPIALVLSNPTGRVAQASYSEIVSIVTELFESKTDLAVDVTSDRSVEECRGRLYCLAASARRDYSEERLRRSDGGRMSYREHLYRLREEGEKRARYLLLINNVTRENGADRISALLLDTDVALTLLHDAKRAPGWKESVEAAINEQAIVVAVPRAEVASMEATRRYLQQMFDTHLRPFLAKQSHWEPWGRLTVETGVDDSFEILLDGQMVGTTKGPSTELTKVRPGRRELELRHPSYAVSRQEVTVEKSGNSNVDVELLRTAGSGVSIVRPILLWTGVAVAVVGAALITVALVKQDSGVKTACIGDGPCSSDGFTTVGYDPAAANAANVNPSGVLMAPLGYSLAATGLTWSLGTALFGDDDDLPWIQAVIGVALGVGAYGLSAALN